MFVIAECLAEPKLGKPEKGNYIFSMALCLQSLTAASKPSASPANIFKPVRRDRETKENQRCTKKH